MKHGGERLNALRRFMKGLDDDVVVIVSSDDVVDPDGIRDTFLDLGVSSARWDTDIVGFAWDLRARTAKPFPTFYDEMVVWNDIKEVSGIFPVKEPKPEVNYGLLALVFSVLFCVVLWGQRRALKGRVASSGST